MRTDEGNSQMYRVFCVEKMQMRKIEINSFFKFCMFVNEVEKMMMKKKRRQQQMNYKQQKFLS